MRGHNERGGVLDNGPGHLAAPLASRQPPSRPHRRHGGSSSSQPHAVLLPPLRSLSEEKNKKRECQSSANWFPFLKQEVRPLTATRPQPRARPSFIYGMAHWPVPNALWLTTSCFPAGAWAVEHLCVCVLLQAQSLRFRVFFSNTCKIAIALELLRGGGGARRG